MISLTLGKSFEKTIEKNVLKLMSANLFCKKHFHFLREIPNLKIRTRRGEWDGWCRGKIIKMGGGRVEGGFELLRSPINQNMIQSYEGVKGAVPQSASDCLHSSLPPSFPSRHRHISSQRQE